MKSVRIWIKPTTKAQLEKRGKFGDTWDSIIQRLLAVPHSNIYLSFDGKELKKATRKAVKNSKGALK